MILDLIGDVSEAESLAKIPVTIGPKQNHTFWTNWTGDTSVRFQNSDQKGHAVVYVNGIKKGESDVPANYDHTDKRKMYHAAVTVYNTGNSTFTITVW